MVVCVLFVLVVLVIGGDGDYDGGVCGVMDGVVGCHVGGVVVVAFVGVC